MNSVSSMRGKSTDMSSVSVRAHRFPSIGSRWRVVEDRASSRTRRGPRGAPAGPLAPSPRAAQFCSRQGRGVPSPDPL